MSTLTWITEKELERNVKNKETNFVGRKTTVLYITTIRKTGKVSSHQSGNERRRKKSEKEHIKRVTRKFLEVPRCSRAAKQRQRSVLHVQSCFRWRHRLALHDFIFCFGKL